jgi:hypothetical protein
MKKKKRKKNKKDFPQSGSRRSESVGTPNTLVFLGSSETTNPHFAGERQKQSKSSLR